MAIGAGDEELVIADHILRPHVGSPVFDFHLYLVGTSDGVEHFNERHELLNTHARPDKRALAPGLECHGRAFERGFVRLAVDAHGVQAFVAQHGGHSRQIDRLDEPTRRVMAEPMRVDVVDMCAPAQLGDQVLDPARCVRPALAAEHGADIVAGWLGADPLECLPRLNVQWQPSMLVALTDDVDPPGAGLHVDALPGQLLPRQRG